MNYAAKRSRAHSVGGRKGKGGDEHKKTPSRGGGTVLQRKTRRS